MASNDSTEAQDTVSREAHEREKRKVEELEAKIAERDNQLVSMGKLRTVEKFLRSKQIPEAELDTRVSLLMPHLSDVEVPDLEKALSEAKFAPLTAPPVNPTVQVDPNQPPADVDGGTPPPVEGGFAGPNPGSDGQPVTKESVGLDSPEYRQAIQSNDLATIKRLFDETGVKEPTKPW